MRIETKNKLLFCVSHTLRYAAMLSASGVLMQTFLASLGFSADKLYIYTSVVQAVNVTTILLASGFANTKCLLKRAAIIQLPSAALFFSCIPFCVAAEASVTTYLLLLLIAALHAVFSGLNTICEYKLPYIIFRPESYGAVLAVSGICGGFLSLAVGAMISFLSSRFAYLQIMLFALILAGVFLLLCAWLHFCMKKITGNESEIQPAQKAPRVPLLTVFRQPAFLHLLPANILRGFAYGMTTVFAAIALELEYSESVLASIALVQSAANLIGCAVLGIFSRYIHPRFSIAIGSVAYLFLPLLLVPNTRVFLLGCGIVLFGREIVNNAVPAGLRYIVSSEIAGSYNAWRMFIHLGSGLLATTLGIILPVPVFLVLAAAAQLLSGAFYLFLPVTRKEAETKTET